MPRTTPVPASDIVTYGSKRIPVYTAYSKVAEMTLDPTEDGVADSWRIS
jgi:hypothetical protein